MVNFTDLRKTTNSSILRFPVLVFKLFIYTHSNFNTLPYMPKHIVLDGLKHSEQGNEEDDSGM